MYCEFSEVFKLADSNEKPQFTACAAVLVYKEMFAYKYITGEINNADFKKCEKFNAYDVPQNFSNFPSGSGHCSQPSYLVLLTFDLKPDSWLYGLFDDVRFITDPQDVKKRIQKCNYKFKMSKLLQENLPKSVS
ncbi:hypothetical protein [Treponema sp. R80B11-R83G3]